VSLIKRGNVWHFAFRWNGKRYRGSCKTSKVLEAKKVESLVLARLLEDGRAPGNKKIPTLTDFSNRFFKWLEALPANRPPKAPTRKYYRVGWRNVGIHTHRWYEVGPHNDRSRLNHREIVSREHEQRSAYASAHAEKGARVAASIHGATRETR
jgi:hypothetical protein